MCVLIYELFEICVIHSVRAQILQVDLIYATRILLGKRCLLKFMGHEIEIKNNLDFLCVLIYNFFEICVTDSVWAHSWWPSKWYCLVRAVVIFFQIYGSRYKIQEYLKFSCVLVHEFFGIYVTNFVWAQILWVFFMTA